MREARKGDARNVRMASFAFGLCTAIALGMAQVSRPDDTSCERLASLRLKGGELTLVQPLGPGALALPGRTREDVKSLAAMCRVAATLKPTSDSDIRIEVWMPASKWNGKFLGVGNGGWNGAIAYAAMIDALRQGYATASTDTGHTGSSASFALGHPEKLIDFGYRAVHEMTTAVKKMVSTYYGEPARRSYWSGCSAGGRQGLKEAQRFPDDYDGVIAGAPAADWTGRAAQSMRVAMVLRKDESSFIPSEKYPAIHAAVLEACDALDGVKDGVLENPRRCRFDPGALQCKDGDSPTCLTRSQVEAARQIYATVRSPFDGRPITGLERGSELGWSTWGGLQPFGIGREHFSYVVFRKPDWDYRTFDFESDLGLADRVDAGTLNAIDPGVAAFFQRGGKLIQYHGWNDPQISPGISVEYYLRVAKTIGDPARMKPSYRLFMVPGMAHCRGGEGPDRFDALRALEEWVERGQPPDRIVAARTRNEKTDRTRPLCPYPQTAKYMGTGSTDEAANFVCGM